MTPLMVAAQKGHREVVVHLLELGALAGLPDNERRSALHFAAAGGHEDVAQTLLAAGADPGAADKFGETPLHLAVAGKYLPLAEMLLAAGADPNAADEMSASTPLHRAARTGQVEAARLLVRAGVEVDAGNEWGRTPLHVAAGYGHVAMIHELIGLGADPNGRDLRGETPLHRPAFLERLECMTALLERGAGPNIGDAEGNTPLHLAAAMNREEAVRLLLAHRADLEAVNQEGITAVDWAIINPHFCWDEHNAEAVEVLLDSGATLVPERIPVGDRHALWPQLTPREFLEDDGHLNYALLPGLADAQRKNLPPESRYGGPTYNEVVYGYNLFHDAVDKDMPGLVKALLEHGASPDASNGTTRPPYKCLGPPLYRAAYRGNVPVAVLFLDYGALLNGQGTALDDRTLDLRRHEIEIDTPLITAVESGNGEVAEFLLQRGADLPLSETMMEKLGSLLGREVAPPPSEGVMGKLRSPLGRGEIAP